MADHTAVILHVSDHPEGVERAVVSARGLHGEHPELDIRIIVNGAALSRVASGATRKVAPDARS